MTVFNVSSGDLTTTPMPTINSKKLSIFQILTIDSDNNFLILCISLYTQQNAFEIITVSSSGEYLNSTELINIGYGSETFYNSESAYYDAEFNTVYIAGQLDLYSEVIFILNFSWLKFSFVNTTTMNVHLATGCLNSETYYLMDLTNSGNYTLDTYDIIKKSKLPRLSVVGLPQNTNCDALCSNNQIYVAASSLVTQGELSVLQIDLKTGEASKIYESSADVISSYNYWVYENYFTQMVKIKSKFYLITVDLNTSVIVYQVEITKLFDVHSKASYLK
ncbi:hypothetical protein DLAC_00357 [Tieghemostelium lacteum]|uniref:Uncharacterized protein n=1 Tax=Tieghemostelium lacteum TaxID=361077 RepID=A0A152A9S6_TIELA|nr:hypothetical protein DLAC_00357 [Tieghemostelium lacteum]|eukprot:KYR02881.1 hypothetical protein DLAC_00357 [Tieghemostelium lacteum]